MEMDEQDIIRLDIALYFQRNPFARETTESLALRVGRSEEQVAVAVDRLVEQSVLECRGAGRRALYRYVHPYAAASPPPDKAGGAA